MIDEVVNNTADDVAAAMRAAEPSAAPPPASPAVSDTPQSTLNQPRDANGRFQPISPAAPEASGAPPATPGTGVATPSPPAQPGAAPEVPGAPGAVAAPPPAGGVTLDPSKPPQGWRPEMKDKWATIPEDIRTEVIRREEAGIAGVQRLRQYYEPMEKFYEVVATNAQYFQHIGADPQEYVRDMIQTEQTLALGNPAQKMQTLIDLADSYGVPLKQILNTAMNGQLDATLAQAHQQHKTPPAIPPEVARELQELRAQANMIVETQATQQLEQFLSTSPQFFEEVSDKMEQLLESGVVNSYQEAYDLAVWQDLDLRQRSIAQANGAAQATAMQQRQAAAGAVAAPLPASVTPPGPQNPGQVNSIEDDIRSAWNAQVTGGMT